MKNLFFPLLFIFGYGPILMAQSIPPIVERAARENSDLILFPLSQKAIHSFPDLPKNFKYSGANFVKNKNGLFMLPQGTGRVYKLSGEPGNRSWIRIDSTYFTGYNFGAYTFSLDQKLYSFGGHGFWYSNGNLREFNEFSKEWNARSLSESIPWSWSPDFGSSNIIYLDTARKKMTIQGIGVTNDNTLKNTRDEIHQNNIYQLDIQNGDWTKLGKAKDTTFKLMAELPWGLLVNQVTVIDLENNRYLQLNELARSKMIGLSAKSTNDNALFLSFAIDSTLYFGNMTEPYDSVTISRADLIDSGIPLYVKDDVQKTINLDQFKNILILILSLLLVTLAILYWKRIKPKHVMASVNLTSSEPAAVAKPDTESDRSISFRSTRILDLLEEREKSLLEFLYHHSVDERLTTIDEINKVIGVANRSNEIQKRMRSDLIGSINQKLNIITKDKKPVIEKQRSEFDKRSFEYFIQPSHMALVEKVLGKK
jgi:hypothetical protein